MESLKQFLPHIITALVTALTVGVPSWITSFVLLAKLQSERKKVDSETSKTAAEALSIETDNFLKMFGEFQELRKEFDAIKRQVGEKDAHIANAERLIRRIGVIFREFLDDIEIGFWEADASGGRLYFNCAWLKLTGLSLAEARGNGWHKCIHPDDLDNIIRLDEAMMFEGATLRPIACRIINQKNGECVPVTKSLFPVFNSDGSVYRYYGKVKIET
jgi:PAS domain S-box-containing protein